MRTKAPLVAKVLFVLDIILVGYFQEAMRSVKNYQGKEFRILRSQGKALVEILM
jgi:hypothetical protein